MKLALGTAQFGMSYGVANTNGQVNQNDVGQILRRANQAGIDTLDTAMAYGDSECVLGAAGIDGWKTVTKLSPLPEGCQDVSSWVRTQVQGSLKRLGLNSLYGLLLHQPSQLLTSNGRELYCSLQALKQDGLVAKVGLSVYGPSELDDLYVQYPVDMVQAPLNILDQSLVSSGWAERLKQDGVEIHTRSAFLQGLLLMPKENRPAKFKPWTSLWEEWDRWLDESQLSPLQACLHFTTNFECVDKVIVGVDSLAQLFQIVEASQSRVPNMPEFKSLKDDRLLNPSLWSQL